MDVAKIVLYLLHLCCLELHTNVGLRSLLQFLDLNVRILEVYHQLHQFDHSPGVELQLSTLFLIPDPGLKSTIDALFGRLGHQRHHLLFGYRLYRSNRVDEL